MSAAGRFVKSRWFIGGACLVLGAAAIVGIRFITYKPADKVHYHANFALYINGQQELFKGPAYYAETKLCQASAVITPIERAHMHDNVNSVVHVHDHAVTWGQFFANINWTLGSDLIESPDGTVYDSNGNSVLHVVLNSKDVTGLSNIANTVIKDQDRLLLSYGVMSVSDLQQQYKAVPATAHKYDVGTDPLSCSGPDTITLHDRLAHLF